MTAHASDQDLTSFDIFVLALSVLSIVNMVLAIAPLSAAVHNVVLIVDGVLCLIFLADFFARLKRAPHKRTYLIHDGGWLDFLGSLPFPGLRLARLFRMARVSRIVHKYGPRGVWEMIAVDRAGSALLGTLFLTIIVLQFGSMFVLAAEARADNANILTASDALWWSYVTVTTVGYGDRFPVTTSGRVVGVAMLTIGVGRRSSWEPSRHSHRGKRRPALPSIKSWTNSPRALSAATDRTGRGEEGLACSGSRIWKVDQTTVVPRSQRRTPR